LRFIPRHCGCVPGTRSDPSGLPEHVPDSSFRRIRAPFLRPFYEAFPFSRSEKSGGAITLHDKAMAMIHGVAVKIILNLTANDL
jgi:hypothetical protein